MLPFLKAISDCLTFISSSHLPQEWQIALAMVGVLMGVIMTLLLKSNEPEGFRAYLLILLAVCIIAGICITTEHANSKSNMEYLTLGLGNAFHFSAGICSGTLVVILFAMLIRLYNGKVMIDASLFTQAVARINPKNLMFVLIFTLLLYVATASVVALSSCGRNILLAMFFQLADKKQVANDFLAHLPGFVTALSAAIIALRSFLR